MGVPTTGIEVGRTQIALDKLVEARDTLLRVARYPVVPGEPAPFARARAQATELAERLAGRIPSLQIELKGLDDGDTGEVRLDGHPVEPATIGLPRKVNPGKHVVTATAPGYHPLSLPIVVEEGEGRVLDVHLRPDTEPADAGDDGGAEGGLSPLVFVGFGLAGAGLLTGAITGGVSLSLAGDVKDQCSSDVCPTAAESDADTSVALAHVSTVSFVVAALGAGVGTVGLFWPELFGADAPGQAFVRPLIGPGGLGVYGRF